jgi:hypothetical protein
MRCVLAIAMGLVLTTTAAAQRADGQLRLDVVDAQTGQPMAARMHLKNARGRGVGPSPSGQFRVGADFFYIDGTMTLPLAAGQYSFEVEAGPEFRTIYGNFEIERHADDRKRIEMHRIANLAAEGWWAGDVDAVGRALDECPLAMRAEGLHVLPLLTWSGDGKEFIEAQTSFPPARRPKRPVALNERLAYGFLAARDEGIGGALLMFGNKEAPGQLRRESPAAPSSRAVVERFHQEGVKIAARVPYPWDLPMWLASGKLDAISLIHHHARRDTTLDDEKDGRVRDRGLYGGKSGNGRWSEAVYHHALNCGLRIPPAAGSGEVGEGDAASPIGTNRVYVDCGDAFSYDRWWEGLTAGRVFVTNGPLLRPRVQGRSPGHVFRIGDGGRLSLEIGLRLAITTPVEYLEIVKNGEVDISERLSDWKNKQGRLPPLEFDDSGWFLVRAVTTDKRKHQLASTGPYYVEKNGRPRISRRSVQFFLDWITAASDRIRKLPGLDDGTRHGLLAEQAAAREFFEDLLARSNAE